MRFAIRSTNVLTPDGLKKAKVVINDDKVEDVIGFDEQVSCSTTDFGDKVVMPALVDTHVHINEPGRTEWEGFETATKAAAAGGVTMLVDMPLNSSPVTTTVDALMKKKAAAKNKLHVDCGFYGGVIPGNEKHFEGLISGGVLGFKAFMIHSGIDEFPAVDENELRIALKELNRISQLRNIEKLPLLVHAEYDCGTDDTENYDECSFETFLKTRPRAWENRAIETLIGLSRDFDYPVHIVHLSSSDALPMIRDAKKNGLKITVETCPHYLFFSSEEIERKDTRFKCTPPIRENENREKLWQAVADGTIDFIVTDHSPCEPDLKCTDSGSFEKAWGGISSLQLSLPAVWTEARKRGISIETVNKLMSSHTAMFINLNKKGSLEKGFDADIIVFDPESKTIVSEECLYHKHKLTPYSGRELYGKIEATYLRGEKIFEYGKVTEVHHGRLIAGNNQKSNHY